MLMTNFEYDIRQQNQGDSDVGDSVILVKILGYL